MTFDSIGENFIAGLLAGVISTVGAWLLKRYALPWIEERFYPGFDCSGEWIERYQDITEPKTGQKRELRLKLSQKGKMIEGSAVAKDSTVNTDALGETMLILYGEIFNNFICIIMAPQDKKKRGACTYLLEVSGEGEKLKGFTNYLDGHTGELDAATCVLERVIRK